MSDVFEDRKKGFERKYQLDGEQEFRLLSRRDKIFGAWLAEKFGITGDSADLYIREIAESNFREPGDEDMLDQARLDAAKHGVQIEDSELRAKLAESLLEAKKQLE